VQYQLEILAATSATNLKCRIRLACAGLSLRGTRQGMGHARLVGCAVALASACSIVFDLPEPAEVPDSGTSSDGAGSLADAAPFDASPPDGGPGHDGGKDECDPACAVAGGSCIDDTCVIVCTGSSCSAQISCPAGYPCEVQCGDDGSCAGGVDCSAATGCTVTCGGVDACDAEIVCGAGRCSVDCLGAGSCENGVSCSTSCACDVVCSGPGSCADEAECPGTPACDVGAGCRSGPGACHSC
jgi:hypothetical protein